MSEAKEKLSDTIPTPSSTTSSTSTTGGGCGGIGFYGGILQFLIYLICLALLIDAHLSSEAFLSQLDTTMLEFDGIRAADQQELNRLNQVLYETDEKVSKYEVDIGRLSEAKVVLQKELDDVTADYQMKESEVQRLLVNRQKLEDGCRRNIKSLKEEISSVQMGWQQEVASMKMTQEKIISNMQGEIDRWRQKVASMQLTQEEIMSNMQGEIDGSNKIIEAHNAQMEELEQERLRMLDDQLQLELRVQEQSIYLVNSTFGEGPHFVEFHVLFPPMEIFDNQEMSGLFIVEIAPINVMPHSVHVFLELIQSEFYVGKTFNLSFRHIVGLSTHADDELKLKGTTFREYNENFPHKMWTVGLMGKGPVSGPSFYVSVVDNTKNNHGDPCIGGIIHGFDTIEMMHSMPETDHKIDSPIMITSTRFVSLDEVKVLVSAE
mmetsp:Transcript_13364/g.20302  ORF Transcript_13364/g.20302 Transcript_13364/m.20302 type:complete len:434 (-) Transcript_13364:409-1710(-)